MADNSLKRLSRKELLELMISQGEEIERLQEELRIANEKLAARELMVSEAGSLAEAALKINHVFEAADAAAQQYLDSIRNMVSQEQEALVRIREKENALRSKPNSGTAAQTGTPEENKE